jgi:hypothetical protein
MDLSSGENYMSGGSSVPNAPNLTGNTAAANATAAQATSDAAQQMNTAQAYNTNAQSNLSNVTNTANSAAAQIGNEANQNLSTYGSTFAPLQQQQAAQAQAYGSAANVQKLQGQAVANSDSANQAARANSAQALAAEGVDPGSIQGAALDRQAGVTGAANTAGAATQSALNTQNTAIGLTQQANQLGMQVGQQGTAGEAQAAQTSEGGQSTINQTNQTGVSNLGASANYLNSGTSANSSAANIANTGFQDQMQQATMQQSQDNAALGAIGSVAGAAMHFMERGGMVPPALPTGEAGPYVPTTAISHSGKPVNARHFQPTPQLSFRNMDAGGPVTAQGALPAGSIPGTTDRKPAMLTPGEFVVPHDAVQHMGTEYWHKQVDKAREASNKRRAIPVPYAPHMSAS